MSMPMFVDWVCRSQLFPVAAKCTRFWRPTVQYLAKSFGRRCGASRQEHRR